MGKKVFISYKYSDANVAKLGDNNYPTVRTYVDELQKMFGETPHIYKAEEDGNDLSKFKDERIESSLKTKIFDSSVTIILISPNMKDSTLSENDQWIPWEVSYSLKEHTRNGRTSSTNALLAVVLPDRSGSYNYYITDNTCASCHCRTLNTPFLFEILKKNTFNIKQAERTDCNQHPDGRQPYKGDSSYMPSVKWVDFIKSVDYYLDMAIRINEKISDYDITKVTV